MALVPAIFLLALSAFAQHDGGVRVSTQEGDVIGSFSAPTVRQFLGVPFATAGRWQNPVPPPKRNRVLNATAFGDSCPQLLDPANVEFNRVAWTFNRDNETFVPQSEDCLTVNIWSPNVTRKQGTAVLLWIYGGAFNWGTSRLPIYDGTNLVRDNDDITVVTFNYRLNIFGQPNAPQLDLPGKTQNFGFLDVEAAVQWVHNSIQNFGGDPNRITLFGQSAGSIAVETYALAHPNDTIIKGLIQQSSNSLALEVLLGPRPRVNTDLWNTVADLVGCGSNATAAQFSCMQNVPTKTLEDAVIQNDVSFNPIPDDLTYFTDPIGRITSGKFLNVPLLLGTTRDEGDAFTVAAELISTGIVVPTITEIVSDLSTALITTCPYQTAALAHIQAKHKVFEYLYEAVFPNLSLQPGLRAFHGADIHLIFGTYNNSPIAPTPGEISFSRFMQSVWVGFARDPEGGLLDQGWPQFDPAEPTYALLGGQTNETGATFVEFAPFGVICRNTTLVADSLVAFQSLLLQKPASTSVSFRNQRLGSNRISVLN